MRIASTPLWIACLLGSPLLLFAARLAIASPFILGGIVKLHDFQGAITEQVQFGLPTGWFFASLSTVVELGGSTIVLTGRLIWLGAGGIVILTFVGMTASPFCLSRAGSASPR